MFTGLIEELGIIKKKTSQGSGIRFEIDAAICLGDLKIGDSININGACQTVVVVNNNSFVVDTIEETLNKTNFKNFEVGDKVNLERSLRVGDRLGGHFVLGHVDTVGTIQEIKKLTTSHEVKISFPKEFGKYLVNVGSIAVDGISLTLAKVEAENFSVAIIPHSWDVTNLANKKRGDKVNLEFDILGKYTAKILGQKKTESNISEDWLRTQGF